MAKLDSSIGDWPEIPKIPVEFKPCNGGRIAHVVADLGILGEWEIGNIRVDEATVKECEEDATEFMEGCKVEIQHAFNRLILRIAAVALVKRGEGCFPMVGWYSHALVDAHGEEKANEMLDGQLANMLKYRKQGFGLHEA